MHSRFDESRSLLNMRSLLSLRTTCPVVLNSCCSFTTMIVLSEQERSSAAPPCGWIWPTITPILKVFTHQGRNKNAEYLLTNFRAQPFTPRPTQMFVSHSFHRKMRGLHHHTIIDWLLWWILQAAAEVPTILSFNFWLKRGENIGYRHYYRRESKAECHHQASGRVYIQYMHERFAALQICSLQMFAYYVDKKNIIWVASQFFKVYLLL